MVVESNWGRKKMKRVVVSLLLVISFIFISASADAGYKMQLNKYTERGSLYSFANFDAKLMWHATYFSDKFRKAFEKYHIKRHHMEDEEEISQFKAEMSYDHDKCWEFFIGVYSRSDYKQFSSEKDSFWKLYLTTESGEKIKPISVEMIPISPYERVMFPYLNRWSKAYKVLFPKVALGKKFSLTLQSIVGKSVLKWRNK